MTSVVVLGQPYWGARIARALTAHTGDMRAAFVPQSGYARLLASPPRSGAVVVMRVGYRVGASTTRGRLFDAYWSLLRHAVPHAMRCHYWLGTDVLNTLEDAAAGTLRSNVLSASRDDLHLADAPWLVSELESIGLHAVAAPVPQSYVAPSVPPQLPPTFRVLTYLAMKRFDFYGGPAIIEAARRLPGVPFDIVGCRRDAAPGAPDNVMWRGWVADMARCYAGASVVVRIPRHDGMGATVIEGLLNARQVIYTHDVPFVRTVPPVSPEQLRAALVELEGAHRNGQLTLNLAGRAYAMEEFEEARLTGRVAAAIRTGL